MRGGRAEQMRVDGVRRWKSRSFLGNCGFLILLEHRVGFEPTNTGFADLRVSHFATGALRAAES